MGFVVILFVFKMGYCRFKLSKAQNTKWAVVYSCNTLRVFKIIKIVGLFINVIGLNIFG